jgi:hypothetical protein
MCCFHVLEAAAQLRSDRVEYKGLLLQPIRPPPTALDCRRTVCAQSKVHAKTASTQLLQSFDIIQSHLGPSIRYYAVLQPLICGILYVITACKQSLEAQWISCST